jgi:thiol:disulfide interchange protein DsbD
MLLFAFVGGVILNVMPCVLPVISIKVLSLIQHANMKPKEMRRHGWAYTGGIVASFLLLAAFVAVLKGGGEAVGWGFQFQSPLFVAGLASVVFAFGLSMLGVFEIMGVSGDKISKAEHTTRRMLKADLEKADHDSLAGSFVNGVFATVLATPCTAPFLGAALGFAFTQPLPVIVLTFVCVGFGLAFPFLLLAFVPAWTRFLPRPGDWMNTFKALMGFLLMATVVWLLDVLGKQVGAQGLTQMLAYIGLLGLAAWVWGRFGNVMREAASRRRAAVVAAVLVVAGAGALLRFEPVAVAGAVETDEHGITWKAFSEDEVRAVAAGGQPVFIDFTAAWCWTCKVNESAVINTDPVREVFKAHNVATFKGDWTNRDPAIGEYLRRHGRAGVPMYVVIPPGKPDAPVVLPEVITKDMVVEAIEKAAGG